MSWSSKISICINKDDLNVEETEIFDIMNV